MKILLTGGLGFIGSNFIERLSGGHEVFVYDIKSGKDIFDNVIESYVERSDIVIHLAALTNVLNSFEFSNVFFRTNVLGTARIVDLCIEHKKKLIFPSTGAVHIPESSPYAKQKLLAERIVQEAMNYIPAVVLRLFNVFGPGMSEDSGSIMYRFLHDDKIEVYGNKKQARDFIHVYDVVSIIQEAMKSKWDGKTVEVGTGKTHSIAAIASLFAEYRKRKVYYKPSKKEVKWAIADTTLLDRLYKKKLYTNLPENIKELCQEYQ